MEDIPEKILDKRKDDIYKIFDLYMFELDTTETRNRIKNDILKILVKDVRLEKLKKINSLK